MTVSLLHEAALWDAGFDAVAGIDEAGRGALAGTVSVGVSVVTRCDSWPDGLTDSKLLSAARREAMLEPLASFGVARAVGHASSAEIDEVGIVAALRLAARRALDAIPVAVDAVLLDGTHDWLTPPPADLFSDHADEWEAPPVTMIVKGDRACASIAAASVLAKVERDALMAAAHEDHPEYGWDSNKGYGAASHLEALRTHGPSPLHRVSWKLPFRAS
ncbi:ribonuclease HII [Demequina sp. SYSU T00192]|uniref:Ribonuclease HII n=1 Tax=Demequina litoralis TaxID=3051660 RepID=A0ABT8G983_9MICO|nr:ribonuclease HII [Demequina sp. SYSU T00192]MDN4475709.1 ribonuclease HII [Demequina sp. SYSU T00192]